MNDIDPPERQRLKDEKLRAQERIDATIKVASLARDAEDAELLFTALGLDIGVLLTARKTLTERKVPA